MAKKIYFQSKGIRQKTQGNRRTNPLLKQCCGHLREVLESVGNHCASAILENCTKTSVWKCLRFVLEDDAEGWRASVKVRGGRETP